MQETHWPKSRGFEFHKGCAVIVSDFVSLNRSYHLSQLFCAIPEMVRPQYLFLFDLVHQNNKTLWKEIRAVRQNDETTLSITIHKPTLTSTARQSLTKIFTILFLYCQVKMDK